MNSFKVARLRIGAGLDLDQTLITKLGRDGRQHRLWLIVSCFLYALLSSFFLAVFLIKYRIEYILTMPAFALLFAQYLSISLKPDSVAQRPEKLFREPRLILSVSLVVVLCIITTFFDIPVLEPLASQHYIIIR